MTDPWQFLILDRNTATERDVKSAYARLLKQHRPDQDPEGFQKLRQAYEAALASVVSGRSQVDDLRRESADALAATSASPPERAPWGSAKAPTRASSADVTAPCAPSAEQVRVDEAVAALRSSIGSRIRQRVRESLQQFDVAAKAACLPPLERSNRLLNVFGKDIKLLAEVCTLDWLLQYAQEGDPSLAQAVVRFWKETGGVNRLADFAAALQRRAQLLADATGALLMIEVAAAMGRWQPQVATELANKAFPHLPPDKRDACTRTVENEVALGHIFAGFPEENRTFWFAWINGTNQRCNWRDAYSRQMLHFVIKNLGPGWVGFSVLQRFMPPPAWQELVSAIRMFYG